MSRPTGCVSCDLLCEQPGIADNDLDNFFALAGDPSLPGSDASLPDFWLQPMPPGLYRLDGVHGDRLQTVRASHALHPTPKSAPDPQVTALRLKPKPLPFSFEQSLRWSPLAQEPELRPHDGSNVRASHALHPTGNHGLATLCCALRRGAEPPELQSSRVPVQTDATDVTCARSPDSPPRKASSRHHPRRHKNDFLARGVAWLAWGSIVRTPAKKGRNGVAGRLLAIFLAIFLSLLSNLFLAILAIFLAIFLFPFLLPRAPTTRASRE